MPESAIKARTVIATIGVESPVFGFALAGFGVAVVEAVAGVPN